MAANLAPVFVNDSRVTLQGDPKPNVSKIMEACGKETDSCDFVRLRSKNDSQGQALKADDVIDRLTSTGEPVYLKCVDRDDPSSANIGRSGATSKFGTTGERRAKDKNDVKAKIGFKSAKGQAGPTTPTMGLKETIEGRETGKKSGGKAVGGASGPAAGKVSIRPSPAKQEMYDPHKETGAAPKESPNKEHASEGGKGKKPEHKDERKDEAI